MNNPAPVSAAAVAAHVAAQRETARTLCQDTVSSWAQELDLHMDLSEPTRQLSSRVLSWIGPQSVIAGVKDVLRSHHHPDIQKVTPDDLDRLANRLAHVLVGANLLATVQHRKPGNLG